MTTVTQLCAQQMFATFHAVNDDLLAFIRELGSADHLPAKFTIDAPTMNSLESAIEKAVEAGELQRTEDLCSEYKERFAAYLAAWRKKIAKGATA